VYEIATNPVKQVYPDYNTFPGYVLPALSAAPLQFLIPGLVD